MSVDSGRDEAGVGTSDDDDEALSWGESSDKSYVEGPVVERTGWVPDQGLEDDDGDDDELPEGVMSSTMLVVHGVFGAIFLLFAVAWLKSISNVAPSFASPLADWMWRIGTWFAVASPVIWFLATVYLVPVAKPSRRFVWFVVGVVVLIPWPFLIGASA
ncbi:hypothetical protein [Frondihabitans cladoniiphilus]|uniref:DNA polymerase III subunit gamma/tau n=1 Tax=Frondihabitans cladoniiphilus TaxID=715785 RepID=A0ABP8VJX1_9MICO